MASRILKKKKLLAIWLEKSSNLECPTWTATLGVKFRPGLPCRLRSRVRVLSENDVMHSRAKS
jgi:hypothetical protein